MRSVFQISENTLVVLVQSSYFDINIVWHSLTQFQNGFFYNEGKGFCAVKCGTLHCNQIKIINH